MHQATLKIYRPESTPDADETPHASHHEHRLLVVDDEQALLQSVKEILSLNGYNVLTASHPREALTLVRNQTFSLFLVDQRMPHMTGLELLAQTKVLQPHATRILITGAPNLNTLVEAINQGEIFRFLAKPWKQEDLLIAIKNGVQRYELVSHNQELQRATQAMNEQLTALNHCLEEKVRLEGLQGHQLSELNRALSHNFQQAVQLGFRTLETFYPWLGRQIRRVQSLTSFMAAELNLPDDQREILEVSATLYDLGLVGMPPALIRQWQNEPQSLTNAETQLLKQHPILGQELASFVHHLAEVSSIIRSHHERFDGHGFPDGLKQEEIPWLARLIGVAAACALAEERSESGLDVVRQHSGTAFDPDAVAVLEQCLKFQELPAQARDVPWPRVELGMTLAEDVFGPEGWLLAPRGQLIDQATLARLNAYFRAFPLTSTVSVVS